LQGRIVRLGAVFNW